MRTLTKKYVSDIFGVMYYNYYLNRREIYYNIRREDDYIDYGNEISRYFQTYNDWSEVSRDVLQDVVGRILDFGAGAGRHALFFQEKGHEVVALDNSRFAMKVMKKMGVKKIVLGDVNFLEKLNFSQGSFDTILMMFNNFGLGG
ncbi:class I SAM-dependent methyltransferase, partial [bacterium]|nr:class I SAM-dependent methyltransferase [bacterium]